MKPFSLFLGCFSKPGIQDWGQAPCWRAISQSVIMGRPRKPCQPGFLQEERKLVFPHWALKHLLCGKPLVNISCLITANYLDSVFPLSPFFLPLASAWYFADKFFIVLPASSFIPTQYQYQGLAYHPLGTSVWSEDSRYWRESHDRPRSLRDHVLSTSSEGSHTQK